MTILIIALVVLFGTAMLFGGVLALLAVRCDVENEG